MPDSRLRFRGSIAGLGSASGVRVVVGRWHESPYGAFADVMLADADGTRVLLAPTDEVAGFVSATYHFDRVEVVPVEVRTEGSRVHVTAGDLELAYAWAVVRRWARHCYSCRTASRPPRRGAG